MDLLAISADGQQAWFDAMIKEATCRFWNQKAALVMWQYLNERSSTLLSASEAKLPRWICNRIDLVHEHGFWPYWDQGWYLIEFDPEANEGRWGVGDVDRLSRADLLEQWQSNTAGFLKTDTCIIPRTLEESLSINAFRRWLWDKQNYTAGRKSWFDGKQWVGDLRSAMLLQASNISIIAPQADDQGQYEFVIIKE